MNKLRLVWSAIRVVLAATWVFCALSYECATWVIVVLCGNLMFQTIMCVRQHDGYEAKT